MDVEQTLEQGTEEQSPDLENQESEQFDESSDLESDDTQSDESLDESSDEQSEEGSDGDMESYPTEEAYLEQFGLSGKPKTIQELAAAYKEQERQLADLKTKPVEQKTETEPPFKTTGEYLGSNLFTGHINSMIENQSIKGEENVTFWKGLGGVMDNVNNSMLQKVARAFDVLANQVASVQHQNKALVGDVREGAWRRFSDKDVVSRAALDPIMDEFGFLNYNDALVRLAMTDDTIKVKYSEKLAKKSGGRLPQFITQRRSSSVAPTSKKALYAPYLKKDGTLDKNKLHAMGAKGGKYASKAGEVVDAYLDDLGKGR